MATATDCEFRVLTEADAKAFHRLRLLALDTSPEAFSSSAEDWRDRSLSEVAARLVGRDGSDDFVLGAFASGNLVGNVGMHRESGAKLSHKALIWGVFVEPDWRGRGLARELLRRAIARTERIAGLELLYLAVATVNEPARRLYLSLGFRPYGVERNALVVGGRYYHEEHMQLFLSR